MIHIVDPIRIFTNQRGGTVESCKLKSKFLIIPTATPQTLTATAGKIIRVMNVTAQSNATTSIGVMNIQNNNGSGAIFFAAGLPARDGGSGPWIWGFQEAGHFETENAGDSLYFTASVQNVYAMVEYIEYTP